MKKFLAIFFALSVAAFANEKVYKLKLASTWESTAPILGETSKELAELAEKMSNGRIKIRIDYPSKHKSPFAILDFVKTGQYDLGYTASYYYKGKDAKTMFFTAIPFGMTTDEQHAWYEFGGGKQLEAKVYDAYGIDVFRGGNTGTQMGGWFKKKINSLADLKGLKIRIPGFGGEVMAKLGASVNTIPTGELYLALETGTIDAVEWVSPAYDMGLGFYKIAKYYYTGWQEPNGETQFFVNKKAMAKLPADLREILKSAMAVVAQRASTKAFYENTRYWQKMKSEYPDIEILSFPSEVLKALNHASDEILNSLAAQDELFKEILDSQREFLSKARQWSDISINAYIKNSEHK